MSTRASELADQFQAANADVLAFVTACDGTTWNTSCAGEEWTIGTIAAHIADSYAAVTGWIRDIAAGRPVPVTPDDLEEGNTTRATANAGRARDNVLAALRERGATAADVVRSLSDEDLAHSAAFGLRGGEAVSAEWLIRYVLISHPRQHLASMRASAKNA
ncbi:MAG TPA: DinB family protein [Ktedonobacterales bacterium]|nr:DinB family protein [Ktedonobacterales bacterium]